MTWEEEARRLTPWEERGGVLFKREDLFAPLCKNGPNGAKFRQLLHLFARHRGNATHVMTAASVLSPQHSMTAVVAYHYGLPSLHIIGATTPEKAVANHVNVRVASRFGAKFEAIKVAYNPELQRALERRRRPDSFVVPYGITTAPDCSEEDLRAFHEVGGIQVKNLPGQVETLIVPAGSCNTLTSVLYGLVRHGHGNLRELVSVGIGPDKVAWVQERLTRLGVRPPLPFRWNRKISLHDSGFASYGDRMPEEYCGVRGHPTYEGKILRWMKQNNVLPPRQEGFGMWIVAGEMNEEAVEKKYPVEGLNDSIKDIFNVSLAP